MRRRRLRSRTSFTGLYPLDNTPEGRCAAEKAHKDPLEIRHEAATRGRSIFQRLAKSLTGLKGIACKVTTSMARISQTSPSKLTAKEREAFILMDLINHVPVENIMVRNGVLINAEVVSEVGTYGI
ncbi:hypothetical protein BJ742DRAFT_464193 [Cladochytrium replicatum]|nr:hypothetical protein BJ742DRAFT_464193 [Cladochytrium replicatum]